VLNHEPIASPSPWVKRFAKAIPQGGLVLDLACGAGRHAAFLAGLGHSVLAVDQDTSAVKSLQNPNIEASELNLEASQWPLDGRTFSGIVVTNYLYRPFLDRLPQMLIENGILIYETFAIGNERFGRPSNPNFLLSEGELLRLAEQFSLKVLAYEDIYVDEAKPAIVQRICAVKGHLNGDIPLQFDS
jgi:SAM-dependent methyltransferase